MPSRPEAPVADTPSEDRLREVFNRVEPHIERRYGVPVRISDVPNPFTGDLDGESIQIDHEASIEEAVFILVHLFGHTVQWNLSEAARSIGYEVQANPTEERLEALHLYEREACRYSLALFHETGVFDLDQWLSDFAACDFAYLRHVYSTGETPPFRDFWRAGAPRIEPLPVPAFTPTRWRTRWEGIVV